MVLFASSSNLHWSEIGDFTAYVLYGCPLIANLLHLTYSCLGQFIDSPKNSMHRLFYPSLLVRNLFLLRCIVTTL